MNRNQLSLMGYINVTDISCLSYEQEELRFKVPSILDYPNQKHISGKDFIFLFLDNHETWFKEIDLDIVNRSLLSYQDGLSLVTMDDKNPENTKGTIFAYPFKFEEGDLQRRKSDPDCVIDRSDASSQTDILKKISVDTLRSVKYFLTHLTVADDKDLKPFPNDDFLKAFDSSMRQDEPIPLNRLKNFYTMIVLIAQHEDKISYNLGLHEFVSLVNL